MDTDLNMPTDAQWADVNRYHIYSQIDRFYSNKWAISRLCIRHIYYVFGAFLHRPGQVPEGFPAGVQWAPHGPRCPVPHDELHPEWRSTSVGGDLAEWPGAEELKIGTRGEHLGQDRASRHHCHRWGGGYFLMDKPYVWGSVLWSLLQTSYTLHIARYF